ncbi:Maf family protein [Parvibaculum sp.]|uniref:Maf family protein n=1 Tax=Parvibaculum sp. TaxID=2024848 RepID=UPI002BC8DB97|nr:Maf family protein [Parvibaculum sp.]HUD50352.1 Maf family protein [Parvibaculum sp.]
MSKLILASGSKVRATLLAGAGLDFSVRDSGVDEDAVKRLFRGPVDEAGTDALALELAMAKAAAVSHGEHDAFVIGADQILSCEDMRFDKPRDMDEARANLLKFRGRTHILHSGVVLARAGMVLWSFSDRARLTMRDFSDGFLDTYLARLGEKVKTSVGCYQLEGPGIQLFEKIEGDYFTILGLPLLPLLAELRRQGVALA